MSWLMVATAYVANCDGCTGTMASGLRAEHEYGYVAASPAWAFGTCLELFIDRRWQRVTVQDRGSKVRRRNRLDILAPTVEEARTWGKRKVRVRYCDDFNR